MKVSVGVTIRDHFSDTAGAVRSILLNTHVPFTLHIVDCGLPERYRREVERETKGRENIRWIRSERLLHPNESRNLLLEATDGDDYVALVENDNVVPDGWLEKLIDACERHGADIAVPLLYDGPIWKGGLHHDRGHGKIIATEEHGAKRMKILADPPGVRGRWNWGASEEVTTIEMHCILFRRKAFDTIGPFDDLLTACEEVDVSLAAFEHGIKMILEPAVKVRYNQTYRISDDERELFFFRWNVPNAEASVARVREKWGAEGVQDTADFARGQRYRLNRAAWLLYRASRAPRWLMHEVRARIALAKTR
jgi:GT2 family glycosyltransferase